MESFIAGFAYGGTTVLLGQPFDTIKTLQQTSVINDDGNSNDEKKKVSKNMKQRQISLSSLARQLYSEGGVQAFYRGGLPLLIGGGLMRSAQFGFYHSSLNWMHEKYGKTDVLLLGCIDPQVAGAGFFGGIGRAFVESPFEMVKVRRQVQKPIVESAAEFLRTGAVATFCRNGLLFSSFTIYMDLFRKADVIFVDSPFLMAGFGASMAWITVWPLDVVKSRMQSGQFAKDRNMFQMLADVWHSGHLFRGIVPGLARSFTSNGTSMVVYKYVETKLLEMQSIRLK